MPRMNKRENEFVWERGEEVEGAIENDKPSFLFNDPERFSFNIA